MSNIYLILFKNQLFAHKACKIQTYDIPSCMFRQSIAIIRE